MKWFKENILNFVLAILVALSFAYLLSVGFRQFIEASGIDAGLLTGFVALLALIVSIQQGIDLKKQSVRDKNFAYRLSVKSKFEDMSQVVIAKLYSLDSWRHACVATMENLKKCLGTDTVYRDGYNITETDAFGANSFKLLHLNVLNGAR